MTLVDLLGCEMRSCNKERIDILHITSWDTDHCNFSELKEILQTLKPWKIEYPGYNPHTATGQECLKVMGNTALTKRRSDAMYR